MEREESRGLRRLSTMDDFRPAEGSPDPRGWTVLANDGSEVGHVRDLLVDDAASRIRYLDVELDTDRVGAHSAGGSARHVLLPIGRARLHDEDDRVVVDGLGAAGIAALPRYDGAVFDREYESAVRRGFFPDGITPEMLAWMTKLDEARGDYYGAEDFDDEAFFRGRGSAAWLGARAEAEAAYRPDAPDREVPRAAAREGSVESGRERAGLVEPGVDTTRAGDEAHRPGPDAEWNRDPEARR